MKGLILKDLYIIKGNFKSILAILVGMTILVLNNMTSISFFLPFFCVMMCLSTFSYDDFNNWNPYAISLPNGRKNVVKSKYVATLIMCLLSTVFSILLIYFLSLYKSDISFSDNIMSLLGSVSGILILVSCMYPCFYKFGSEKGRIFMFVGVFAIMAILGLLFSNINIESFLNSIEKYLCIMIPIILFIFLLSSYIISLKIYNNKEF